MRGDIYRQDLYARGKMVNHSGWAEILPRHMTPSDIDCAVIKDEREENITALDSNGNVLLMEFSSSAKEWDDVKTGQRRLYESMVRAGQGKIRAVLCRHETPMGALIDSVKDVRTFQAMYFSENKIKYSPIYPREKWIKFVKYFVESN